MAGTAIRALDFKLSLSASHFQLRLHSNSQLRINNLQLWRYSSYSNHNPSIILRWQPRFNVSPVRASATPSDPVNDGEGRESGVLISRNELKLVQPLLNFAANNFLPLALIAGVALGFSNPTLGCLADKYYLSKASILLLTPVFSRLILQLNLQPQEFVTGLALFCCMPTTLSSGVSLTQLAGGNFALALAMTVISNLLGILVVPFSISKFVASGVGISIPTKQLFGSLVITLLIPLILGKVLRESIKGVADFADKNRKLLSIMNALFLSLTIRVAHQIVLLVYHV